ncbi:SGM_3592 family protein [Streptomyces sp. NPDC055085]
MAAEEPRGDGHDQAGDRPWDAAGDQWDDLVLDESFVRAADTTEPSARARMLAARWRAEGPEPEPWRSDEPPAGWFFSKSRRRRWRRR